ncbi:MAG: T9SS type A sorting domain-containing protein [Ignavibacteriaceae bacterium]|nr:T9SS type A sorting domain-containing protein [Ignavibacteriaceae bacterium]
MRKIGFIFILFFVSFSLLSEIFPQVPDQIQKYRAEPYGSYQSRKKAILDGNNIRSLFINTGEIAEWPFEPSLEWPKGTGHSNLDGMTLLIGAEVTAPGNQAVIHPIEASYREQMDRDPVTGETWGLEPIPGYSNLSSLQPAMSVDPNSWPATWPEALDLLPGYDGVFPSYFGKNSAKAYETFFVMDDSRDGEFLRSPYKYFPILSDTTRGGLGLRIETRYLQFSDAEVQNVLFMKYKITNISDFSYDKTCFGYYVDPGVGGKDSGGDDVRFNKDLNLTYAWDHAGIGTPGGWETGYMGFALLETPQNFGLSAVSLVGLAETPSNPWPIWDETVWQSMVGGFADTSITNTNVNIVFSSGPFPLPKFSTDSIATAIICANDLDELILTSKTAKQFISNNFSLNSTSGNVSLTLTKPIHKEKVSGVLPIQYSLSNYTGAATYYIYHFTPEDGWSLIGKDENNSGYFYWQTESVRGGIHHQIKIISVTDNSILAVTSGFFTIQNHQTTQPNIFILSPTDGAKLTGEVDVKFYGGDADGDTCLINFFYKADVNSIPFLVASNLRETDLSFTWKTNNSSNSLTGELIGQIISKSDTSYWTLNKLTVENERSNPSATNYMVERKSTGTGDIELHIVEPSLITGDDYLMVFDSAYFDKPTLYYKLYNKTNGNAFVGDVFEVQNGVESRLFDGLRVVANNDTGSKAIKGSLTKWVAGNSNSTLGVSPVVNSNGWQGKEDYEITFYDHIVDTSYIKSGTYVTIPLNFQVINITSNYKTKIAMTDPDKSGSFTPGDEIRILEFVGASAKTSWSIFYQEFSSNPVPPVAGDVFRIVAKKEFVKGDSITFTTSGLVGVRDMDARPSSYSLSQNYPNPFNPVTTIQFSVPQNEMVKIKVYDFLGAEIATLVNKEMNSGSYEVDFNGKTFASGIYFVRMEAGKFVETKKVVLLK